MTLQEHITNDLQEATKQRNVKLRDLLKVLVAEMTRGKNKLISDEETIRIVRKFKANAIECGNLDELPILESYLPVMLSEEHIREIVKEIIFEYAYIGMPNMGKVMQHIKNRREGDQIDAGIASRIAKELLTTIQ